MTDPEVYEASDEASEGEFDRSLSLWRGWSSQAEGEDFKPVPLDLYTAASIGQYDAVRSLIKNCSGDVDLNRRNRGGWSALMYASYIGHDNVVNLLLEAGVNVNLRNNKGQTALMLASSCGNESVGYFLLQQGAELEAKDNKGWTSLFHATYSGHQNMVKFLLINNANMEAKEPARLYTPLMDAAAAGHEIIVQSFLQHKVNVNAKSCNGDTARSLALIHGHTKIVSLIDNHIMGHSHPLRSEPGLALDHDYSLSSSDESFPGNRSRPAPPRGRSKHKGPSLFDGPEHMARLISNKGREAHRSQTIQYPDSFVPQGYMKFDPDEGYQGPGSQGEIRFRDVTSPIDPSDHRLDSSGGAKELNEVEDAFSKTGALTIKSSSSSSGGLAGALGISRQNSLDGTEGNSNTNQEAPSVTDTNYANQSGSPRHNQQDRHKERRQKNKDQSQAQHTQEHHPDTQNRPHHNTPAQEASNKQRGVLNPQAAAEQAGILSSRPGDLCTLLEQLGLEKWLPVFEQEEINLSLFLSLTDKDLKEVGINKMGPRKKLNNAIARWHSNARPANGDLEQAYADKMEAEMQEMAIQLHRTHEKLEQASAVALQERELRSVAEGCLMESKSAWQGAHHLAAETRQRCVEMHQLLSTMRQYQAELCRRLDMNSQRYNEPNSLVNALQEGLSLENRSELSHVPTNQLTLSIQKLHDDIQHLVTIATMNTEELLGNQVAQQVLNMT